MIDHTNLKFLEDSLKETQTIWSWALTPEMQLLYTNCPEETYFFSLFSVSSVPDALRKHYTVSLNPYICADHVGFVWISSLEKAKEYGTVPVLHLFGPVFTSEMTETYLLRHLGTIQTNEEMTKRMRQLVNDIPSISPDYAGRLASILHYALNKEAVRPREIELWTEQLDKAESEKWGDTNYHGSWEAEQRMLSDISKGIISNNAYSGNGRIGAIGSGDPLRQAKNEIIVFAALATRAAVSGGVSYEGALNLSDYFIQKTEAAETVSEVRNTALELLQALIQRVRRAKENSSHSPLVRHCMDYVETHLLEKISLADLAEAGGYSEYYVSRTFKSETGMSLFSYINSRKIEMAKELLKLSKLSVADLSYRLSFSSPSYFSSMFKKATGMTPAEYQKNNEVNKDDESEASGSTES